MMKHPSSAVKKTEETNPGYCVMVHPESLKRFMVIILLLLGGQVKLVLSLLGAQIVLFVAWKASPLQFVLLKSL